MKSADIPALRIRAQRIVDGIETSPADLLAHLGAIQAQDYPSALWALGCRLPGSSIEDIEAAIDAGSIVRSWPMRGTLHFVAARDLKWMLNSLAPRAMAADKGRLKQLGLDLNMIAACGKAIEKKLARDKRISRDEAMSLIEKTGIRPDEQRGYHVLWHLAQRGLICLGPLMEGEQALVLLDDWVASSMELEPEEARAELARRYFASHGPATLEDFAGWSGMTLTHARDALASVAGALAKVAVDDIDYWLDPEPRGSAASVSRVALLLPAYDEFIIGYKDRRAVLDPERTKTAISKNGVFYPTIVVDGRVIGTWKRAMKRDRLEISLAPFEELEAKARNRIDAAARGFGAFWRKRVDLK